MKAPAAALALLLSLACLPVGCKNTPSVPLEDVVDFVLEVEEGRDVVILQLTDIQIIDSSQRRTPARLPEWSVANWAPQRLPELAWKYTRATVDAVKPDLIVLSGDNVYGEFDDSGTMLQALIAEMESYNVPWTIVFGNHDNETHMGVEWTCEQYENAPHCLFKRGETEEIEGETYFVTEGNGNFNIGITQGGKLTEVVWLMDSNGHTDSDRDQNMYSHVGLLEGQIGWFTERCEALKAYCGGTSPKSIGFFHHPLRALGDGLQKYGYMSSRHDFYDENGDYGTFSEIIIPENDDGDCGAMHKDAGQYIDGDYEFHALLKKYGCEGWFFGHDHENNASVCFEGVRYTYGLKASLYDSYVAGDIGGTRIAVGKDGLRVEHVYYTEK